VIDESPVGIAGSTPPAEGPPDIDLRAVDGRLPGRRGLATRQRLLAATASLLETTGYRDLKVVEVAREAGTSPATFYQYFPDAESAVLVLAAELTEAWHDELATLVADGDWIGNPDGAARHASEGFLDFWTAHRAVLGVLDLASTEGDERFRDLRTWLLNGPTTAMVELPRPRGPSVTRWPRPGCWWPCWLTCPITRWASSVGGSTARLWWPPWPVSSGGPSSLRAERCPESAPGATLGVARSRWVVRLPFPW